jgi:hypothetical protein
VTRDHSSAGLNRRWTRPSSSGLTWSSRGQALINCELCNGRAFLRRNARSEQKSVGLLGINARQCCRYRLRLCSFNNVNPNAKGALGISKFGITRLDFLFWKGGWDVRP